MKIKPSKLQSKTKKIITPYTYTYLYFYKYMYNMFIYIKKRTSSLISLYESTTLGKTKSFQINYIYLEIFHSPFVVEISIYYKALNDDDDGVLNLNHTILPSYSRRLSVFLLWMKHLAKCKPSFFYRFRREATIYPQWRYSSGTEFARFSAANR